MIDVIQNTSAITAMCLMYVVGATTTGTTIDADFIPFLQRVVCRQLHWDAFSAVGTGQTRSWILRQVVEMDQQFRQVVLSPVPQKRGIHRIQERYHAGREFECQC